MENKDYSNLSIGEAVINEAVDKFVTLVVESDGRKLRETIKAVIHQYDDRLSATDVFLRLCAIMPHTLWTDNK